MIRQQNHRQIHLFQIAFFEQSSDVDNAGLKRLELFSYG
jgi:hypothetical protein